VSDHPSETPTPIVDRTGCVVADVACVQCGYNLRGMLVEGPCPGCGLRVLHVVHKTFDDQRRLRVDIACLRCGYDLRSLSIDGKCPECGLPVAQTVRGDLLQFAAPAWVRKLALGATLLLTADICGLATLSLALLGWALSPFLGSIRHELGNLVLSCALPIMVIGAIVAALAAVVGLLEITKPEPRISVQPKGFHVRRLCRYSLSAALLFVTIAALSRWPLITGVPSWWGDHVALPAALVFGLGVLPLSTLRHLRNLLRRVPDLESDKDLRLVMAGVWIADSLLAVPLAGALVGSSSSPIMALTCPGALIGAVCCVVGLFVLHRARVSFQKAADRG
jgi:hypothetical protein